MKKSELRQIIREEISKIINESINGKWTSNYNKITGRSTTNYTDANNSIEFTWIVPDTNKRSYFYDPNKKKRLQYKILGSFSMSSSGEDYGHTSKKSGEVPEKYFDLWDSGDTGKNKIVDMILNNKL